jgi:HTH-type transcriptional regulator / antitoxin HigA
MESMTVTATTINRESYRRLVSKAMPVVIESEEENERMLAIVEKLMDKGEAISPEEDMLLRLLSALIQDFEERFYTPRDVTPLEMLRHLMESRGVKQSDLWELFGSKGVTSEVLNGKRGLSKTHIKKLAAFFNVSPELFL